MTGNVYLFSDLATALNRSEYVIRNWFTRNKLDLGGYDRAKGKWRRFDDDDVDILTVANEMILIGVPVSEAVDAVRTAWSTLSSPYLYAAKMKGVWRVEPSEGLLAAWDKGVLPRLVLKIDVAHCRAVARRRMAKVD